MAQLNLADQPVGPTLYLHGQRKRFHVPEGLETLLDEMSREVLKYNPENIYKFLAEFVEGKIEERNRRRKSSQGRAHSWEWRTWSTDGSSALSDDELKTFVSQFNVPFEAAEHLATIIQSVYRGFHARKDYKKLIQEKKRRKESLWDEWIHEGKFLFEGSDVQEILLHYGLTLGEANECATKIQAMFRGHLVRKSLTEEDAKISEHLEELGITHEEANKHATTIQNFFRTHQQRQQIKAKAAKLLEDQLEAEEELEELKALRSKSKSKVKIPQELKSLRTKSKSKMRSSTGSGEASTDEGEYETDYEEEEEMIDEGLYNEYEGEEEEEFIAPPDDDYVLFDEPKKSITEPANVTRPSGAQPGRTSDAQPGRKSDAKQGRVSTNQPGRTSDAQPGRTSVGPESPESMSKAKEMYKTNQLHESDEYEEE